ncbi:cation-translocating P-type ATPase [Streptomyces sp. GC420]|uniref:cation-translocating P-type ATPase n=1 Tax=Streptomyces sp. GC420 TaxID=2697568 RepID=UPI001415287C|nr:cation-translocating P-type ATPase [Streptomyces sp. GC420]NBM15816.1 HAD-IC family P-type ATPase [Streptomyces sp. GC420]
MISSLCSRAVRAAVGALNAAPVVLSVVGRVLIPGARRSWVVAGGVQIEIRHLGGPATTEAARALEERLSEFPGVDRTEVNGTLGCVFVACDPSGTDLEGMIAVVAEADAQAADAAEGEARGDGPRGVGDARAGRAPRAIGYPGAPEGPVGAALQVAASAAAFGVAVVGRIARAPGLPPVVPALVQLGEATPRLREATTRAIGPAAAEAGWAAVNLVASTLTYRPLGPLVSGTLATARYAEAKARCEAWRDWSSGAAGREGAYRHDAAPVRRRPVPLPLGPAGRYANTAVSAAVAGYGLTGALTRSHDRALALLIAGIPRGPWAGREAFAAAVGRAASLRGGLVLRPEALRRLDRVDTVVLDARLLVTRTWTVDAVAPVAPPQERTSGPHGREVDEIHALVHEMVDKGFPPHPRTQGAWTLHPLSADHDTPMELPPKTAAMADEWAEQGARVLLVTRRKQPVALARMVPQLRPLAEHLMQAARACGRVVLVGGPPGLNRRFGLDEALPTGGTRTVAVVRSLQREGRGVAVVATGARRALAHADLGIGVTDGARRVRWDADVAGAPDVAHLLLTALPEAGALSRRCVRLEAAGALVGAAAGPAVLRRGAWARARLVTDAVTIAGIGAGLWAGRTLRHRPAPSITDRTPWHAMTVRQVLSRLGTSTRGLDEAEAARRREAAGHGGPPVAGTLIGRVAEELANPLTPVLGVGGAISAALGSVLDALLIGGVLGVNALVGGAQRVSADRAAESLLEAASARVRLRRAGRPGTAETPADRLVAGDVIELHAGDTVPADCRLLEATGVEADEASLTGESQLVSKTPAPTAAAAVADRHSMLYQGTAVAAGSALAVVVATGTATEAGRAAQAAPAQTAPPSGVEHRLNALGRWFLPLSIASAGLLFLAEITRRRPLGPALGSAVSLCVAAVPEGLPFVATVAELAAARRLSTRNTLVRSAPTIEALGRTDVLCFDKTGTLTEGRISLQQVSDGVEGRPLGALTPRLRRVVATAALAAPPGPASELTHPTDRAIAAGAEKAGVATEAADGWQRLAELPFEPGRGYHAVLGRTGGQRRLVVKGAPEVVLARCRRVRQNDTTAPFTGELRKAIDRDIDGHARRGLRMLVVAERDPGDLDDAHPSLEDADVEGLCLLGLIGLADPIRPTAAESVARLAAAGVRIVMLTGDHPSTAAAIAAELRPDHAPRLMTGPELDALDDAELTSRLPEVSVFARVTPTHKVRIVTALRAAGRVVAVTGDGANDAPAIRIADIGIAIGSRATPAARTAADVVVTDDRIETIVRAIVEGRAMWASVRKALGILLGGNLGEIAFVLATTLLTGRSALNARQLLLVNLLTDMLPAMAIAARPPAGRAEKLLAEGPESSLGTALTRHIRLRATVTALAAGSAWIAARCTGTRAHADTVALVALVASQLLQTLTDAGSDPVVLLAALGSLAALALVVAIPPLSLFFGSRPLGPAGWAIALTAAAAPVVLSEALRRLPGSETHPGPPTADGRERIHTARQQAGRSEARRDRHATAPTPT